VRELELTKRKSRLLCFIAREDVSVSTAARPVHHEEESNAIMADHENISISFGHPVPSWAKPSLRLLAPAPSLGKDAHSERSAARTDSKLRRGHAKQVREDKRRIDLEKDIYVTNLTPGSVVCAMCSRVIRCVKKIVSLVNID
jgi:hypothetical protein